jgi:hypothetical protein
MHKLPKPDLVQIFLKCDSTHMSTPDGSPINFS